MDSSGVLRMARSRVTRVSRGRIGTTVSRSRNGRTARPSTASGTCTIKHRADGWYAFFSVVIADTKPSETNNPVGIDMGITTFAALSTGEKIENPEFLRANERMLKIAQRTVSHRKKGSKRRKKAVQHLRLEHLRVQRSRRSFHFTLAYRLAKQLNPIFVENLNIKGMVGNHSLAKSISDASWGQFLGILSHSAESAGGACIAVEARGTSQECVCGEPVPKDLSVRIHRLVRAECHTFSPFRYIWARIVEP